MLPDEADRTLRVFTRLDAGRSCRPVADRSCIRSHWLVILRSCGRRQGLIPCHARGHAVSPLDDLPSKRCAALDLSRRLRMDEALSVSPHDLYAHLGTASAPLLVDVRRQESLGTDDRLIIGALHRAPEDVERWRKE